MVYERKKIHQSLYVSAVLTRQGFVLFFSFLNGMMHYSCKSKSSVQIRHISLVCTQKKWSRLGLLLCLSGSPFLSFVYLALGALQAVRKTITAPLPFTTYLC